MVSGESEKPRVIVHLDLDAFYASVEVLENPELKGKPVLVGGRPGQRGVVAAASYEARKFGARSAMPMSRALRLCPDAIVVPTRHSLYSAYSRQVMAILLEFSELMEQISIDEAFLDLTAETKDWEDGVKTARRLQQRVKDEVNLVASLGVASNKLVAKIASDRDKPGGFTVVPPGEERVFLEPLAVNAMWGVGPVTAKKLNDLGVKTIGDLANVPENVLKVHFGIHGRSMGRRAQGIDNRPLVTEREAKSVSQERTFSEDVSDELTLKKQLWKMSKKVGARLRKYELTAQTIAIKLRYSDFTTLSRQIRLAEPTSDDVTIYGAALALMLRAWKDNKPVRLLGVGSRGFSEPNHQLSLLDELANR